jgi:hypothetical protein
MKRRRNTYETANSNLVAEICIALILSFTMTNSSLYIEAAHIISSRNKRVGNPLQQTKIM